MIEFPPEYQEVKLLQKAVRWSFRNRYHIPSLTDLFPNRNLNDLTELARSWQKAGLGTMIEVSEVGRRSVHFSLNDQAVMEVRRLQQNSLMGRIQSIDLSNWIAISALGVSGGALIVSIIALSNSGS